MELSSSSTLPAPSSSLRPQTETESSSSPASFAFLVHSQDTIPRNLPPSVDNKPLARQRRRRTSPEDQAILETEFQRDSKPDKDARRRIVERVALGEKEVQIWFQNRRQNKRRKSQPPVFYEIHPHLEPAPPNQPPSAPSGLSDSSQSHEPPSSNEAVSALASTASSSTVSSQNTAPSGRCTNGDYARNYCPSRATVDSPGVSPVETHQTTPDSREGALLGIETAPPERVASRLRLSMTSSGGAKIISGAETTPSPPRSQPNAPTPFATRQTLRRSYSAAGLRETRNAPNSISGLLRRQPSGRSRDSRAWEFWCDSEARNGLVKKAEQDATGSAADAISLIRSSSGRRRSGVLTPNLNRSNLTGISRGADGAKRMKTTHQDDWDVGNSSSRQAIEGKARNAKLKRAMSSVARLQRPSEKEDAASTPARSDSDKENREPNADSLGHSGQRVPRHSWTHDNGQRRVLGESRTVATLGSRARDGAGAGFEGGQRHRLSYAPWAGLGSRAGTGEEADDEVSQFMRGGIMGRHGSADSSSADEDHDEMDCVAGLLSLSQGNWERI